ncbi:uncharacterized protein [Parasteatoda tepidariorum]|uniref:uncharacterized protein n=1 Tax=Parasteatoda tepidariorum TaxID=114398 RepID=UPI0039BD56D1
MDAMKPQNNRKSHDNDNISVKHLSFPLGIEAALNSRPLVYEEGDENNMEALTPAHFLTGRKVTAILTNLNNNSRLTKLYKQQQDTLDIFWKRWFKEYLLQLRSYHQVRNIHNSFNIRAGGLVLLQEDVKPKHMWKKARITNVIKGRDGEIRTCLLRVDGETITRPIQLVIPLEVDQGGEDVPTSMEN